MKQSGIFAALLALAISWGGMAQATVIVEAGDAGGSAGTAQGGGDENTTGIAGNLGGGDDDWYEFIFGTEVEFSISNLQPDILLDGSYDVFYLGLLNDSLVTLDQCNDCWWLASGGPTVIGPITLSAGTYYVRVADGDVFSNSLDLLSYSMDISITATEVPEPGTLALFGAGLLGLGIRRRRKHA